MPNLYEGDDKEIPRLTREEFIDSLNNLQLEENSTIVEHNKSKSMEQLQIDQDVEFFKSIDSIIGNKPETVHSYEEEYQQLKSLNEAGFFIVKLIHDKYSVIKIPTFKDKREEKHENVFDDYEHAVSFAIVLHEIKPSINFSAKAYFHRGFGSEFVNGNVFAQTKEEALELLHPMFKKKIAKMDKDAAEEFEIVLNQPSE